MNNFLKGILLVLRYGPAKVNLWREGFIYDELTGAYSRRFLTEVGEKEFVRSVRCEYSFSLISIDVDKFKKINDEEGHFAGDKALKDVVSLLMKKCRESDMVFRTGGDEFLILLPETSSEDAENLIKRIKEENLLTTKGKRIGLS
ncbi:MAG: GGDEF domain-containing protein, partial [Candidatus Nealsonbacteria bacterium]